MARVLAVPRVVLAVPRLVLAMSLWMTTVSGLAGFETYLTTRQRELCSAWEQLDGSKKFTSDPWERGDGSHGLARVLQGGDFIEKGAVSTTFAKGKLSAQRASAMSSRGRGGVTEGDAYQAAALSIVLHPRSPFVPTFRADVRAFAVKDSVWYGGGADLTPAYLFEDDAHEWHRHWQNVCDQHDPTFYPRFKAWCDDYFYLPLRKEHRGIGGIFFDDLEDVSALAFVTSVADNFALAWHPIVDRRRSMPYDDHHRQWQLNRRGRYLEFNLLTDRGVKFGLTPEAIDRVMVSAPPLIAWDYGVAPDTDSPEGHLLTVLRGPPRDWSSLR